MGCIGRVEVEAEEGARDAESEDRGEDRRERDERLDGSVVGRRQVARIEREQKKGDEARDEAAQPIDRRVLGEACDLRPVIGGG